MTRAINKNKKPETNNKNRARNYFWGSFGSPCSFCSFRRLPLK
ncbi:Poly(A) polymerase [Pseudomonas orientalis]|nr:Poly(A) polymerase [Pseudomonas orientalis]